MELGFGCAKCNRLEKFMRQANRELGTQAEIVKVESIEEIMKRGLMVTPALYIDGKARAVGRVPGEEEIKAMVKEAGV